MIKIEIHGKDELENQFLVFRVYDDITLKDKSFELVTTKISNEGFSGILEYHLNEALNEIQSK